MSASCLESRGLPRSLVPATLCSSSLHSVPCSVSLSPCLALSTSFQIPPWLGLKLLLTYTHTHTHTHTLTFTHMYTIDKRTSPHSFIAFYLLTHIHTTYTYVYPKHTHLLTYSFTHPLKHMHKHIGHFLSHTHSNILTHTHIYTHPSRPAHKHTHTPADSLSHTHSGPCWLPSTKELCSHVREEKFKWKSDPVIIGFSTRTFFFSQAWKRKRPRRWEPFQGAGE